ncbi:MAG: hypothetical protein E7438_04820 [Ruminococcaceae bacterium]|nr:hypothetical protein [Oscillospiraceae bacterium]
MHEWIMSIGYAILEFFQNLNVGNILTSLSIMGTGMLGIFTVTCVIILVVTLLIKIFTPKQ